MRYRVKNYQRQSDKQIILLNTLLTDEQDIRLIVNETQKKVLCSSMLKSNIESVQRYGGTNNTIVTFKSSIDAIASGDKLTIEVDTGDMIGGMGANEVSDYFNLKMNS